MEYKDVTIVITFTEEDYTKYSKEIFHKYAKFPISVSLTKGLSKARKGMYRSSSNSILFSSRC